MSETIIVYRDRIVPRSEVQFLRRLYLAFERLRPIWVGRHRGDGPLGAVERIAFKHLGLVPRADRLRSLRPRLVHAHFGRGGALALPLARTLGLPLVVHYHGADATKETHYRPRLLPSLYQRRLAALQREAALFVCVSDFIRDRLLAHGFPAEKLLVHRQGVELVDPGCRDAPPPGRPSILFAGRFVEKKGIGFLIEAVRQLQQAGRELGLELVGAGPLEADLRRAAAGVRDVTFRGWLANDALRRRMRGAFAVCVPSVEASSGDAEGLPSTVLEAMASGAPVVATRSAGIAEAVEDGRSGLLVPPNQPAALAAALGRLLDAPDLARAMGEEGRRISAERFNAASQSRRLEEILLGLIGSGQRR